MSWLIVLLSFLCGDTDDTCEAGDHGKLLDIEKVDKFSTAELEDYHAAWIEDQASCCMDPEIPAFTQKVTLYQVRYCVELGGAVYEGSGGLSIPKGEGADTVVYAHGSEVDASGVPSNPDPSGVFDWPSVWTRLSGGPASAIVLAPDYPSLGSSDYPGQAYFLAEESAADMDALTLAVQSSGPYQAAEPSGDLFTFGFSQGGHVAASFARLREESGTPLDGLYTVGGIYDPEAWFLDLVEIPDNNWIRLYEALLVVTYQERYDLFGSLSDVFQAPYDVTAPELLNGAYTFDEVAAELPLEAADLFQASFLAALEDEGSSFRLSLRDNAVSDLCLSGSGVLFHSQDDEEVSYALAEIAYADISACSSGGVILEDVDGFHLDSWDRSIGRVEDILTGN